MRRSSCGRRSGYINRFPISTWQTAQLTSFRFRDHPPMPAASPQSDRACSDGRAWTRAWLGGCASFGDQAMAWHTEHLISYHQGATLVLMTCGRCGEEADELPFRCWFCTKNLCSDCADVDGTCRTHPEAAGLSDRDIAERLRAMRTPGN